MQMVNRVAGAAAVVLLGMPCNGCSLESDTTGIGFLHLATGHFDFLYTDTDPDIDSISQYAEDNYDRVVADLRAREIPTIEIWLYPDLQSLHIAMGMPGAPSWVVGAATSPVTVQMLSPNIAAFTADSSPDRPLRAMVHEYTHCIVWNMNPTLVQGPRWLWEAIAIYEAGEFVDPRSLDCMASGNPPAFYQLESFSDIRIHSIGFTIIEYAVTNWGMEGVVELLMNGGNTEAALGVSLQEFETGWYVFVEDEYLRAMG